MARPIEDELKISTVREILDCIEGTSLLVAPDGINALPQARVGDLPDGYVARRLRADCVLVGWQDESGTWALRLNDCKLKPRLRELLESKKPMEIKELQCPPATPQS